MKIPDLYKYLGISSGASPEELQKAYYKKAKDLHPDLNASETATIDFQNLQRIYAFLSKPECRKWYDERLKNSNTNKNAKTRKRFDSRLPIIKGRHVILAALFLLVIVFSNSIYRHFSHLYLKNYGIQSLCMIENIGASAFSDDNVYYRFLVGDSMVHDHVMIHFNSETGDIISSNGLPVRTGQMFAIYYHPRMKNWNFIDFSQPHSFTVDQYLYMVAPKIENSGLFQNADPICIATRIYWAKGLSGLADLYFYNTPWVSNFKHNRTSFKRLTKRLKPEALISACMEQNNY